jgi:hypothetical protein
MGEQRRGQVRCDGPRCPAVGGAVLFETLGGAVIVSHGGKELIVDGAVVFGKCNRCGHAYRNRNFSMQDGALLLREQVQMGADAKSLAAIAALTVAGKVEIEALLELARMIANGVGVTAIVAERLAADNLAASNVVELRKVA